MVTQVPDRTHQQIQRLPLLIGGGGTGLITVIDDSTPSDYTVVTNAACAPNQAPLAALGATPQTGLAPLLVDFDGSGSSDPDAGDTVVEYTFDFGDGTAPVTQSSAAIQHTYTSPGIYNASLAVRDDRGKASENAAQVVIEALPPGDFYTVTPCRLLDTRRPEDGAAPMPSGSDGILDVDAVTECAVSSLATAVALNVTVVDPTALGHLQVFSADLASPPPTSVLNFRNGQTRADNALVMLSADGRIKIRPTVVGSGSVHVIVDVVGYFIDQ